MIQVANNVTDTTVGGANTALSLTFDSLGVISAASNVSLSINTADIADGAITAAKIADGTVIASDIADGNVTAAKLADTLDLSSKTVTLAATFAKTDAVQTFTSAQRVEIETLTDGATITPDFANTNNFTVTLGGNRALANPTNLVAGQSGSIFIVQDGTGSRTLSWGSYWDFVDGTAPTLTTTASAVDRVDYVVRSNTSIHTVATLNYS